MDSVHISQEQADEFAVGALGETNEREIRLHIADCPDCRELVHQAVALASSLALSVPTLRPSSGLRTRVWREAGIQRPGPFRRAIAFVPAAAGVGAVLVAVAAFTGMVSVRGQIDDLRQQNTDLQDRIQESQSQKVEIAALSQRITDAERLSFELKQAARGDRDLLIALMAPESDIAEVVSVDSNASPVGRLVWDEEQKRVWFVASRLPALPTGETYQIWVNSGGRYHSLGTFNSDASGFARYDTTVPQGIKGYESAVVTIERSGGSFERSGRAVFVTDLSRFHR